MRFAYYNEIDPFAAQWLRNLIAAGHIADGEVDERSIVDVRPDDLAGFAQCHFFAGIGGWSLALRLAGWPDDRPVWTGSCPCQPFSAAGKRGGTDDARHLWPAFFGLIAALKPGVVMGEQVASKDGLKWLDLVHADLEGSGYAVRAADMCAAGVGAPHIRQRLWFMAHHHHHGREGLALAGLRRPEVHDADGHSAVGLADRDDAGLEVVGIEQARAERAPAERGGAAGELADADRSVGGQGRADDRGRHTRGDAQSRAGSSGDGNAWDACDWLPCRDGKARPVEPITQQMVDGLPDSLGRLRPDAVLALEAEIVRYAKASGSDPDEALRRVWHELYAEATAERPIGRLAGVHEAPVLLAFLRELTAQRWAFSESISRASAETAAAGVRGVRHDEAFARTPHQRGLGRQHDGEHPDLVCLLPSILARHAQASWGEAFDANARRTFPLAHGIPGRVGRLRAYGNAIVPQVAAEVIAAFMECEPCGCSDQDYG